jgi:hypothetical protein
MKYERVEFLKPVPIPSERGSAQRIDGASAGEGYNINRLHDDVVLYHESFGGRVVLVPFSQCVFAWVSEDEMSKPDAVTRKEGKR